MTPGAEPARHGTDGPLDEARLDAEAKRILRRLAEAGVVMAVAHDMDRAVVLRDGPGGATRLAVLDRPIAEAFALRDWITCLHPGRVAALRDHRRGPRSPAPTADRARRDRLPRHAVSTTTRRAAPDR